MTGRVDSAVTTQGEGNTIGVVSGLLLVRVINYLPTLAPGPSIYVQASTGAVIIVAAVLTTLSSRRSGRMKTGT